MGKIIKPGKNTITNRTVDTNKVNTTEKDTDINKVLEADKVMYVDKSERTDKKEPSPIVSFAIEVSDLSFSYNGNKVLEDVNFTVNRGDYLGIIGSNGSGKSTLIKLILNIITPIKGEIKLLGHDIKKFSDWSKVGYVSQKASSANINFPATVEEIIEANIYRKTGKMPFSKKQMKEQVYRALEIVDMEDCGKKLIGNLSGGQQQRVFIARMLVNNPEIMFLDEPTSGIDLKSEEAVYCLLARLNNELGITVVMVTHDIGAITAHANKIAFTGNKKVIILNPEEEIDEESLSKLYGYKVNFHIREHKCWNCCDRVFRKEKN